MALAINIIRLDTTQLRLALLPPDGRRIPVTETLTVDTGGAAIGATTIAVAPTTVALQEGQPITWNSTSEKVILAADAPVSSTSLSIKAPLVNALIATDAATVIPTFLIEGGKDTSLQIGENDVSIRDFESGIWEDSAIISKNATINFSGHIHDKSPGYTNIVVPAAIPTTNFIQEVWVEFLLPDGRETKGAAQIRNYQEQSPIDNILQASFDVQFVGPIIRTMPVPA